jgi:hypothetical protein
MISAIVRAMIAYAELEPEMAEQALRLAKNAADYLLSISYPEGSPLAGLPPTYSFLGLDRENVNRNAVAAEGREHTLMLIYPALSARPTFSCMPPRMSANTGRRRPSLPNITEITSFRTEAFTSSWMHARVRRWQKTAVSTSRSLISSPPPGS